MKPELVLLLADIRSVHNVGSMFRTADAAGVSKIYLCGTTPTPLDRFGRDRKDVSKVSLGAEKTVAWEYAEKIESVIKRLREEGFFIAALEQSEMSVDYKTLSLDKSTVLIVGNEVSGVSKEILELSDVVCEIPMRGEKESLNVSVATGIALFRIIENIK